MDPAGVRGRGADARQLCGLRAGSFHAAERGRQLLGASRRWRLERDWDSEATGSLSEEEGGPGRRVWGLRLVVSEGKSPGEGEVSGTRVWGTDFTGLDRGEGFALPLTC